MCWKAANTSFLPLPVKQIEEKREERGKRKGQLEQELTRGLVDIVIFTIPGVSLQFKVIAPENPERKNYDSKEIKYKTGYIPQVVKGSLPLGESGKRQQCSFFFSS